MHIRAVYDAVSLGTGPRMGIVHSIPANCTLNANNNGILTVMIPAYGAVKLLIGTGRFMLCQHQMLSIINGMKGNKRYSERLDFAKF